MSVMGIEESKTLLKTSIKLIFQKKVVIRLLKQDGLKVYVYKSRLKYSSYKGEILPEVET